MDEKLHNLINDPNVHFFLHATPDLKRLIMQNTHPYISQIRDETKSQLLSDQVLILDRRDVIDLLNGKIDERSAFLLRTGQIRVVGSPSTIVRKL